MLFESIEQYNKAKKILIKSEGDIELALESLLNDPDFSSINESELYDSLKDLKEGLGDKILNFFSGNLGGDISKIKTVLAQMKEQELKFNKEEYETQKEFQRTLQDQEALEKDKKNPDYKNLMDSIKNSRKVLNNRYNDLLKSHEDIFNSLEEKIKGLTEGSKRKKKYFNAQRASDVIETSNDRYEKRKAITASSSKRSKELEDFFGVGTEDLKNDVEKAKEKAKKSEETLTAVPPTRSKKSIYDEDPEKGFYMDFISIQNSPGTYYSKKGHLKALLKSIEKNIESKEFGEYEGEKKNDILNVKSMVSDYLTRLQKEANS